MTWECGCGVVNRDSKVMCRACQTPKGMVWTPHGFKAADGSVDLSDGPRMSKELLSKDYQSALKVALLLQIAIGVLAIAPPLFDLWARPMAAYYGCFIVMVFRRPNTPTKVDLFLVKWGFVLLLPFTLIISIFIWRWMGVIR